jgi:hypothetical protein
VVALDLCSVVALPAAAETLTKDAVISDLGVGPVRFGMTPEEATKAAGVALIGDPEAFSDDPGCYYVAAEGELGEVFTFMVSDGTLARISIYEQPAIANADGAHVGDSEQHVLELYKDTKVEDVPAEFGQGHYISTRNADGQHGYVFETAGKTVTGWRAGRYPEVEWVEGCY